MTNTQDKVATQRHENNMSAVKIITVTTSARSSSSSGENESSPCCIFTTNVRGQSGLPDIVAVHCAPEAAGAIQQCVDYVANFQVNSNMVVPDRLRFTLHMDTTTTTPAAAALSSSSYSYFCCLHVTDPEQLDALYEQHMGLDHRRPASVDKLLLLMPMFHHDNNDDDGHAPVVGSACSSSWELPPAPDAKPRMRDRIKQVLEDQCASPCGFVMRTTTTTGRAGTRRRHKQRRTSAATLSSSSSGRVKLRDALAHPDKVDWAASSSAAALVDGGGLKAREVQYLKKHSSHFLDMAMDGVGPERAAKYVAQVVCTACSSRDD